MFRSDRDALAEEVERLRLEREQLEAQNRAMRSEILARRTPQPIDARVYTADLGHLSDGQRAAMTHSEVQRFPVAAAVLLHYATFGIFPLVHLNGLHGKLPALARDDPTVGKAIGFSFIPYFNFYWIVFNTLRLTDRLNLQFKLRGKKAPLSRGFMTACAVIGVIPYVNLLFAYTIFWPIAVGLLQKAANDLADLQEQERVATAQASRVRVAVPEAPAAEVDPLLAEAEREVEEALAAAPPARRAGG